MPWTPEPMSEQVREALHELEIDINKGYHFEQDLELNGSDSYNSVVTEVRTQAQALGWHCNYDSTQGPVDDARLRMNKGNAVLKMGLVYDDCFKLEGYVKA